ncbi:probable thiol peroxidase [Acidimicrobiaceae bacterium]|nr:probable thiol peroxidase [Acidimicrobiaceae bacterium]
MASKKKQKSAKKTGAKKKIASKKAVKSSKKKSTKKSTMKPGATVTLGGNAVSVSGKLPATGKSLPKFSLTTSALQDISNKDIAGKRVIFNIFPSIDTPTCATSTRKFNELASSLQNTDVYCVSADLPFAQGRFCGTEGLSNVKTASSFRSNFGVAFGVNLMSGVLKGVLARAVVVADEKGKVLHTELVSEIANEPNYDAAINSLR